ncbi:MAG: hypothetical protein C7B47_15535 [Sulfobacillus thermosulfidooxidans]|uniref:Uncharacterized protein n=1 Tax=Sulfobacillus thermosulfidooxidans TaxID=28034 RepID=A0A2T2WP52_SULTH|nr:MAG: hypothetical protein C7B47_15535 [Sulfobacillus thermosulfidooxidans]
MSRHPIENLSFFDIVQEYRNIGGYVLSVTDVIFAVLLGGIIFFIAVNEPGPVFLSTMINFGIALTALAGTMLGIAIAAFAVTTSILSDAWLDELKKVNGYPALVVPYWLTGIAWVFVVLFSILLIVSIDITPRWLALGLITGTSSLLGVALSWSLSLFGSIVRLLGLKVDTYTPDTDVHRFISRRIKKPH